MSYQLSSNGPPILNAHGATYIAYGLWYFGADEKHIFATSRFTLNKGFSLHLLQFFESFSVHQWKKIQVHLSQCECVRDWSMRLQRDNVDHRNDYPAYSDSELALIY